MSYRRKDKRAIKKNYPAFEGRKNWRESRSKWKEYYEGLKADGVHRKGRHWFNLLQ